MGIEPTVSTEQVASVYLGKVEYAHPDVTRDPEERKVSEDRTRSA